MINAYAAHKPKGELTPFQYQPDSLGRQDVDIQVEFCGICHSDLSMLDNEWGMTSYPFVPGHEVIGIISAKGEDVKHLQIGQRVGLGWHSGYCMTCPSCKDGDNNLCATAESTIVGRHGGFADTVRANSSSVVILPENLDIESAGPLFCGGITVFNPLIQFNVKPTHQVGIIGIGGLGHMALQFLNAWGCKVTAFTSSESKKQEAIEMGAHSVVNSRNIDEINAVAGKFDFIISTVNVKLDWNLFVNALKPKGRLHFVGATLQPLDLGVFPLIMGQRSISGSPVGSPGNIAKMLEFAALHNIKPVIEKYPFEKVNEAIEHLRSGKARYRIVLHK